MRTLAQRWRNDSLMLTGLATVVVILGFSAIVFTGKLPKGFGGEKTSTVRAVFADTNQLYKGADVRVNGVDQGRVIEIKVNRGGRSATVEMELKEEALPVYRDARADIRWKLVLGGNVAIVLHRGTPSAGELTSELIPQRRTSSQVELDDITATLQRREKSGLRSLIAELGQALRDHRTLGHTLGTLADASPSLRDGIGAVRGQRDGDLRKLVAASARTAKALDSPAALRNLIEGAATTLETTARRAGDVESTISRAARTLPVATRTLVRLRATLGIADPLLADLREPVRDVAPTLAALQPVVVGGERLVNRAKPLLRALRPAAGSLARAAAVGVPLLDELIPALQQLDREVLPGLAKRSPVNRRATYEMVGPAVAGVNGAAGGFDAVSNVIRFPLSGGSRAVDTPPCKAFLTDPTSAELARCQSLMGALKRYWEGIFK